MVLKREGPEGSERSCSAIEGGMKSARMSPWLSERMSRRTDALGGFVQGPRTGIAVSTYSGMTING